ncbi:SDR family NAD(P)-dependent oxidoreductase [Corynebacterium sp. sy017]|uniref:SDR family NAD(P)-dependent oxidoreductase n=1 Tax=unclassified Corynebacterium TaxID=2624378 RepID=UPI001185C48F|nr:MULTISPECIES: SDR family NAD(P)-dependent oxidoreductase [unclassified Corynebacterium]MBP3088813.1 SDR family NAD(P)-dependent oxidoreductase [Corynebacterium sp. sy017]QDZ42204.1 SDR family NAD(P)-dependent oxidoreductase [Corynebacterium sp. sy039]TSD91156.1 SDR family NAD(P)-dependent oxidoreductase [Corynebacterium sp. SY003]
MQNSCALVTGGASGLGAATAQALFESGYHVIALDLTQGDNSNITYVECDVTNVAQVASAIEQAKAIAPLALAVNCAGICPSARVVGKNGVHSLELFTKTINVNLIGTFNVLSQAAIAMRENEPDENGQRGVIINTSSVAAFEGQVGQAAYAASKGGVHSLTISVARDLASSGIRVNSIAPGIVDTPMMAAITPEFRTQLEALVPFPPRLAKPEEYAHLVLSIVENPYLNGETIRLDGALRMPPR